MKRARTPKLRRDLSTPENRTYWKRADRALAKRRRANLPAWFGAGVVWPPKGREE